MSSRFATVLFLAGAVLACRAPAPTLEITGLPACVQRIQLVIRQGTMIETVTVTPQGGVAKPTFTGTFDFTVPVSVILTVLEISGECEYPVGLSLAFEGGPTPGDGSVFRIAIGSFAEIAPPGGGKFPGAPGGPVIPNPRPEVPPPTAVLGPIAHQAKEALAANPTQTEGRFPVPPNLEAKWERLSDGSIRVTVPATGGSDAVILKVIPVQDGTCRMIYEQVALGGVLHGYQALFYATDPTCRDLIWVQYVERKTTFTDAAGTVVQEHSTGPEIDEGIPYRGQGHPAGAGSAWMEDGAGVGTALGQTAQGAAPRALDILKRMEGQTAANISKAVVTWTYWSYLICLDPYRIKGHFRWGFRLTVDRHNQPFINVDQVQEPQWTPLR